MQGQKTMPETPNLSWSSPEKWSRGFKDVRSYTKKQVRLVMLIKILLYDVHVADARTDQANKRIVVAITRLKNT